MTRSQYVAADVPQLTPRAIVTGMLLGAVMCLSNLYVVLKTGWSMGVTITACVLAYAIFAGLKKVGIVRSEFSMLENNAMGSVASAAGYMTGGGNMAALPALLMVTGAIPSLPAMMIWFAVIAALGVFAAIPIKRQLINVEEIPFPTGIATAETIRSLHGHGSSQARSLTLAGIVGGIVAWLRDAKTAWLPQLPSSIGFPFSIAGQAAAKWTIAIEGSLLLVGAGALIGFRTGWSMLLGAIINYGVLAPKMVAAGVIQTVSYKTIVAWSLWTGAGILVSSGLLSFALNWKMIARSFRGITAIFGKSSKAEEVDPLDEIECPSSWFPIGFGLLSPVIVYLMWRIFHIPWWAGICAVPLSIIMGFIAARVTGETDVTPTKALGPVTQLIYGGLLPGDVTANIMGANVTGGIGLHAADLLTDLKAGYLLGARPRQQLVGQLFGVLAGAAIVAPAFVLLVPDASILGSETFPAPGALVWASVSKVLAVGVSALHSTARIGAIVGAILGLTLVLLERALPKKAVRFIPSASGLGIAFIVPGFNAISMFLGALIAALVVKKYGERGNSWVVSVSSGLIAGESLVGIAVALVHAIK